VRRAACVAAHAKAAQSLDGWVEYDVHKVSHSSLHRPWLPDAFMCRGCLKHCIGYGMDGAVLTIIDRIPYH
jgi:hypothetical protein